MFIPFNYHSGWQAICRRVVKWQRRIGIGNELMILSDHDPDLPFSRTEVGLEVRKWCWQP